jgi:hypothetical protein
VEAGVKASVKTLGNVEDMCGLAIVGVEWILDAGWEYQ